MFREWILVHFWLVIGISVFGYNFNITLVNEVLNVIFYPHAFLSGMTLKSMIVTIFILVVPPRFWYIFIKWMGHKKDHFIRLEKLFKDHFNGPSKHGVFSLRLIVRT